MTIEESISKLKINLIKRRPFYGLILMKLGELKESDTTDIALIRSQCGKEITNASWKMVFAADQAEFDALWENLKETLTGIGWDDLVKFDMEKYQKVIDARKAAK